VKLRFPVCESPSPVVEPVAEAHSANAPRSLNALLVDDDELVKSSVEPILPALGHALTAAESSEEALARIEGGFQPEVVILDLNMPGLGGIGTMPFLRAILPRVPVLPSAGRADQTAQDIAETYPFLTLLPKPFSMKQLREHLELIMLS
jgi:CheY-like chemotaxis protein